MNKPPSEAAAWATEFLGLKPSLPEPVAVGVAPAYPALERVGRMLLHSGIALGAQDVSTEAKGAFTGEVSAAMLKDLGVAFAIVGHSERRRERGEDESDFSRKVKRLVETGISPLYCVGETLDERDAGEMERVLTKQMSCFDLFPDGPPPGLSLAYEPVWAIGTGRAATPEMAAAAHGFLRALLARRYGEPIASAVRILYGGSVTPANAPSLFAQEEIDGALVGGASLVPGDFAAIVKAAG
ncbi:MAG: triose-phosphate isomerase [Acidobacteria bacterium]|nr:MAG: triose-phosphate isomerase [Acidobacteriota bacterium]MCE7959305.1 triose-phosphate isomerase [Acidobacteria bacterium ACB2]